MGDRFNERIKYYYAGFALVVICIYLIIGALGPITAICYYRSFIPALLYIPYPLGLAAAECLSDYINLCKKKERKNKYGNS